MGPTCENRDEFKRRKIYTEHATTGFGVGVGVEGVYSQNTCVEVFPQDQTQRHAEATAS